MRMIHVLYGAESYQKVLGIGKLFDMLFILFIKWDILVGTVTWTSVQC